MFTIPRWIQQHNNKLQSFAEIPENKFGEINRRLALHSRPGSPILVSNLIAAWNEETNILSCFSTLSELETHMHFVIIVINNNSTEKTQQTLDRIDVISHFQPLQGCGNAR